MEDIKESTMNLTNNGFFQHVFNFDKDAFNHQIRVWGAPKLASL